MADKQSHHIHVKTQLPDLKSSLLKNKKAFVALPKHYAAQLLFQNSDADKNCYLLGICINKQKCK